MEAYQSKSITPVDNYEYKLSDELKKIAEEELRETEEIRNHGLKTMRDWIMNNPRIEKCRMDSKFILRFLRFRKYSIPMAQEALERYLVFREGAYGFDWFSNLDYMKPNIKTLVDNEVLTVLPKRDKLGRKCLFFKMSSIDPSLPKIGEDLLTLGTLIIETLMDDEENQIRGLNYIADVSNLGLRHAQILPLEVMYKFGKNIEKTCAVRHKGFHCINVHPSLQFLVSFAMKHMPEKLRDRVKFYTNVNEVDVIDKDYLPEGYGGSTKIKEMMDPWRKILDDRKEFFLNYSNMKVNRNLYPKPIVDCVVGTLKIPLNSSDLFEKTSNCTDEELTGIQGSFRKLEID
ncbi:CLUMA_CG003703, isoform A [Clunio marinus]|uniref:CLUMA_CG003703, isoform A n=1 Tax=Clunio marinus TaxID=568069 RepID=A0A1J1HPK1_9DIPT|nr:CLUMA_CG003703, isoform A [Clunio marinus]